MADSYTLPEFDPCHSTLEGVKSTVDFHLKAYLQAVQYQRYGGQLEQWQQCCTRSSDLARFRPAQPDPEPLRTLALPADLYNPNGACKEHLYFSGAVTPNSVGKAWFQHRENYWARVGSHLFHLEQESAFLLCRSV